MTSGLRSSTTRAGVLTLVLNNTLDAIEDGRLALLRHLEPLALDARVLNRLEVVFEELIANVVRHGFRPGSDQILVVEVSATADAITLVLEDEGAAFNPLETPKPGPDTIGGRGVPAMLKIASEVRYEAVAPGAGARLIDGHSFDPRNRLTLTLAARR